MTTPSMSNMTADYWNVMKKVNRRHYDEVMEIRAKNLSSMALENHVIDVPDRLAILNHYDDVAADHVREGRKG